ncbi:MAG: LPS export ABC transporter periplasmic protein LptC [Gammaproteobacteria bacterium]|nr:LPS export ABC transporter periplasmic protein LptC [Gammaproteobacteria bacterium]
MTKPASADNSLRSTRWWAAAVTTAALVVAAMLLVEPFGPTPGPPELPEELLGEPDLYMEDAIITQYQSNGSMKYQLASHQIRYFERDNLTRLTAPRLTLHNESQPPWHVESDHGYVRRRTNHLGVSEEVVFLRRNVKLEQRYEDGRHLRLESPSLYVFPDAQYAETEQDVIVDSDISRTKGVGLQGNLQNGVLKLFSSAQQRVHTIVLPEQFK